VYRCSISCDTSGYSNRRKSTFVASLNFLQHLFDAGCWESVFDRFTHNFQLRFRIDHGFVRASVAQGAAHILTDGQLFVEPLAHRVSIACALIAQRRLYPNFGRIARANSNKIGREKAMDKNHRTSNSRTECGNTPSVVAQLSGEEAATVLGTLLKHHLELQKEAEALAAGLLSNVSYLDVADDVENEFDYDDLNGRAGRRSTGYVGPGDAAWELLEEAVAPFIGDIKRYLEGGLDGQAEELCKGTILGLYRVRDGAGNDILRWAEDFPGEAAGEAFEAWSKTGIAPGQNCRYLPRDFVEKLVPEWARFFRPGG